MSRKARRAPQRYPLGTVLPALGRTVDSQNEWDHQLGRSRD